MKLPKHVKLLSIRWVPKQGKGFLGKLLLLLALPAFAETITVRPVVIPQACAVIVLPEEAQITSLTYLLPGTAVYATAKGSAYHNAGCIYIDGRVVTPYSIAEAEAKGLRPCRTCQ